ncbi:GlyGly-CTERM sorting domain-containing protein [Photobacterium rosenbergii]|uniref:GlyGly-CTERM sorting domain-containing protein n=1 Tax=Photobacterium rosenbergii TaxID=294936 RepID=A0A2T3NKD6_9GAMM|nr:serine protease [Photobacterium rosenbergii]PSW15940.1 GlyGly-CTERM sorting domain-containing protein [Photobacterium rosenbergii]
MKNQITPVALALAVAFTAPTFAEEPQISTKILNGEEASKLSSDLLIPWQAALLSKPDIFGKSNSSCGAVVISEYWAVTAAHCILDENGLEHYWLGDSLVAGTTAIDNRNSNADSIDEMYKFEIEKFITHEHYSTDSSFKFKADNDIALIKVKESLYSVAKPIKIATPDEQSDAKTQFDQTWNPAGYSKANLIASGWGYTEPDFEQPDELRVVKLGGIPMEHCQADFYDFSDESHFVCADSNSPAIKKDVCGGDSGGPLIWQDPLKINESDFGLRVIGVTSNGPSCKEKEAGNPNAQLNGLYTELASYYEWIESRTGLDLASQTTPTFIVDPFVKVSDPQNKTGSSSGGSGGGSLPVSGLLGLFVLGLCRRTKK